jgi:hypothetical protein
VKGVAWSVRVQAFGLYDFVVVVDEGLW